MYRVAGKCKKGNAWAHFEISPALELNRSTTYANIDEAKEAPIVQQLFYLPFVKKVTLTHQALQIERFNILEWEEVIEQVTTQIEEYLNKGGVVLNQKEHSKTVPVTVYAESTPNPNVMKFVANKILVEQVYEFKDLDTAKDAPLATALFQFSFVKEIFIDANYLSITKYERIEWESIVMEVREFIRDYLHQGKKVIEEQAPKIDETSVSENTPKNLTGIESEIVKILDEYIKPAVASDGGNIAFDSYSTEDQKVKVILQGACSGCPSSTITLKNGIESMLKEMLPGKVNTVEAING
jgi:Fe-S cluster biogenesis protein NfuA